MHRAKVILVLAALLFGMAFLGTSSAHAAVVVNEIFPKSSDITKAWVELYNSGTSPVSLDRWRLENAHGSSFILNASAVISPHGFLTIYQPESGISFNINGDSVSLFDEKNTLMDSQSFPGTLGYNTAMGRSADGGTGWTICTPSPEYYATANKPNKCPPAPTYTPTPSPAPSPTPTVSAAPTTTPITVSSPVPTLDRFTQSSPPEVMGNSVAVSPAPTIKSDFRQTDAYSTMWTISLIAGVTIGILIIVASIYRDFFRRR